MYKIVFFAPCHDVDNVKDEMFNAGAGKIGQYDKCSWQIKGEGQFRPLSGSQPFLGKSGRLERVEEVRVEMVCEKGVIKPVIAAFKQAHPYEEPAFDITELVDIDS